MRCKIKKNFELTNEYENVSEEPAGHHEDDEGEVEEENQIGQGAIDHDAHSRGVVRPRLAGTLVPAPPVNGLRYGVGRIGADRAATRLGAT